MLDHQIFNESSESQDQVLKVIEKLAFLRHPGGSLRQRDCLHYP